MLTNEQIEQAVKDSLPSVLDGLKTSLAERALYEAREATARLVAQEVTEWVKAEVIPEIKSVLVESKAGLMATVPALAAGITTALTEAMLAEVKSKLEKSWDRQKIMESLFK